MADKMSAKEIEKKIVDLKIELLKNPTKKKNIKREIARLLTMGKDKLLVVSDKPLGKDSGNTRTKSEVKK